MADQVRSLTRLPEVFPPTSDQMKVTLKTASGQFVKEAEILDFTEYPEFLLWGNRGFRHIDDGVYRECFFSLVLDRDAHLTSFPITNDQ